MNEPIQIVCPHCDTVNRLPQVRLVNRPKCGQCHQPLFMGRPIPLDGGRFDRHLASSGVPLLVDFWAAWCGPCRTMGPIFDAAAAQLEPRARFIKIDVDANEPLAARLQIRSIPSLLAFSGGKAVARHTGVADATLLRGWVEQFGPQMAAA